MNSVRFLSLAFVLVLLPASSAFAQRTYDDISNRSLLMLIRDMGFDDVEYLDSADDDSWTRIQFEDRRRKMHVFNHKSGSLMLSAYYECEDGITRSTLTKVNEWNQTYRWTRAYISSEGSWVLESDLDLSEGMTDDHIEAFIDQWVDLLKDFEEMIEF